NSATGKNHLFTQDAYLKVMPSKLFQIYAGLLTVPLTRVNIQSDATLLGTEPVPLMSNVMNGFSNKGRDTGVMFRGVMPYFEYRLGAFRGLDREVEKDANGNPKVTRNGKNIPRLSARLQMNGADSEEGYFFSENYLGRRLIFSVGTGLDYQPDVRNNKKDYFAFAGDLAMDMPISMDFMSAVSFQSGFVKTLRYPTDADVLCTSSMVGYGQMGVLMYKNVQPMVRYQYRKETGTQKKSYQTITVGLNYFINGHNANIKFGVDVPIGKNKNYPDQYKGTLQVQGYM
ncbi:MAG TPA: hypothetical protein VF857_02940, partial [Spirochaetota bacterium]